MAFKKTETAAPAVAQKNKPAPKANTIEMARHLCADIKAATSISNAYALDLPDFDRIGDRHSAVVNASAEAFNGALNERALEMHCQRLVGVFVSAAVNAGRFWSEKVSEASRLITSLQNMDRDEDQDGIAGYETKAERALQFAADMGLQSYAMLAAAEGAIIAYKELIGSDWKAYIAPVEGPATTERRSLAEQLAAIKK